MSKDGLDARLGVAGRDHGVLNAELDSDEKHDDDVDVLPASSSMHHDAAANVNPNSTSHAERTREQAPAGAPVSQTNVGAELGADTAAVPTGGGPRYRLYKARFAGAVGVVALSLVVGMCQPWFGPIANDAADTFGISLDQVNWLGNIVCVTYLLVAPAVPVLCRRFGLRTCYNIGAVFLVASAWVRYAGTARSLSSRSAYALLIVGQILGAVPQAAFQVLAPKYSETWFDLKGRTTATMVMSISNPVGTAIGQLVPPLIGSVRRSILILGIVCTAVSPFVFLIRSRPPTPPSYSGSQPTVSTMTTIRAILGVLPRSHGQSPRLTGSGPLPSLIRNEAKEDESLTGSPVSKTAAEDSSWKHSARTDEDHKTESSEALSDAYMSPRERLDFLILVVLFGILFAGINTFAVLSNQILEPYGYSSDTAGFTGAALLLSGLLAACVTSPLLDRVFTHHHGLVARIFVPPAGAAWLSLIWAVRPHVIGAIYALFVIIGVCSLGVLPIGLELGCELTRNSATSASILWFSGNLFNIVFILVMSALRASDSASPPLNMHRALIFSGSTIFALSMSVFAFRGHQQRRAKDARAAEMAAEQEAA